MTFDELEARLSELEWRVDHREPPPPAARFNMYESKSISIEIPIVKRSEEQRIVYGWLSVAKDADGNYIIDQQGDVVSPATLEKASFKFMKNSRMGGDMHETMGIGDVVASIVLTEEVQKALGVPEGHVHEGWFIALHVTDDDVWESVKKGERTAFSMGGEGFRRPV